MFIRFEQVLPPCHCNKPAGVFRGPRKREFFSWEIDEAVRLIPVPEPNHRHNPTIRWAFKEESLNDELFDFVRYITENICEYPVDMVILKQDEVKVVYEDDVQVGFQYI
jgi:hypothetical protein